MEWSLFLSETRKINFEQNLPPDSICSCADGSLMFDSNNRQYLPMGACDPSGICACISIEKHKARSSTRHFVKAELNRKSKKQTFGPLDRFLVLEP